MAAPTTDARPESGQQTRRREALVAAALAALAVLAQRYAEGEVSTAGWEAAVQTQLLNAHLTAAALARGGWANLDRETLGLVGERVGTQFGYLADFAAAVPAEDFGAGALARLAMYAGSVRGTFYDVVRRVATANGQDECQNILEEGAAHCQDCLDETARGWVPADDMSLPTERECLSNCQCVLEFRTAAEAAAEGA